MEKSNKEHPKTEKVNYRWVAGQGWVVESENAELKLRVEEALKESDRTIDFNDYLKNYLPV